MIKTLQILCDICCDEYVLWYLFGTPSCLCPGPEEERKKQLAACERVMKEKESVDQTSMNGVLFGLPRAGKSTLLKRFFGKMSTPNTTSTGVADTVVQVHIGNVRISGATIQVSGLMWNKVDLPDEAALLARDIPEPPPSSKAATTQQSSAATALPTGTKGSRKGTAPSFWNRLLAQMKRVVKAKESQPHHDTSPRTKGHTASFTGDSHTVNSQEGNASESPLRFLRECLRNKTWSEVKRLLGKPWTLYLTDSGGQPEFQQLLPVLVMGPSIFFLVFRLDVDLDKFYSVEYMDSTGKSIVPYMSSCTGLDTILQSLSSVASCGSYTRMEGDKPVQTKPRVFLVGTFKDKVSEKQITAIDTRLQEVIKEHDKDEIVQYADPSQSRLIFTIDNLSLDEADITHIREAVQRLGTDPLTKGDYEITTPYPWLIFGIFIRQFEAPILSYERCFTIAQQCGIDTREELNEALSFLHRQVGVIQYFPTEDLHDIVIKDPQYIFDKISSLIVETFTFEKVPSSQRISDEFTKKGIFHSDVFVKIAKTSSELMTPTKFLSLLKHLHIVVPLEEEETSPPSLPNDTTPPLTSGDTTLPSLPPGNDTARYFMPCALSHVQAAQPTASQPTASPRQQHSPTASSRQQPSPTASPRQQHSPTASPCQQPSPTAPPCQQPSMGQPLLVVFKRGYTPQGLFGPLISYLLGKRKRSELQWKLIEDKIFRDQITLQLTRQYSLVLRIHPTYLRAQLIQTASFPDCNDSVTRVCNDVRQCLEDGLREISQRLQIHNPHSLAFVCPEVKEHDRCHPAFIERDHDGQYLECSLNPKTKWRLSDDHCVWLSQVHGFTRFGARHVSDQEHISTGASNHQSSVD